MLGLSQEKKGKQHMLGYHDLNIFNRVKRKATGSPVGLEYTSNLWGDQVATCQVLFAKPWVKNPIIPTPS